MQQRPSAFLATIAVVMLAAGLLLFHFTGGLRGRGSDEAAGPPTAAPSLVEALATNDIASLKKAVATGVNVNAPIDGGPNSGMAALHLAAASPGASPDTVRVLLSAGARVDAPGPDGRTPLMYAAELGRIDVVVALANANAGLDARDQAGRTALMLAARAGRADAAQALVNAGASINPADDAGLTALAHAAAGRASVATLDVLTRGGADPDAPDQAGVTPLMRTAETGSPDRIMALLNAGANPKAASADGRTALDRARARTDEAGRACATILEQAGS